MHETDCHNLFCYFCHLCELLPCTHTGAAGFQSKKEGALPKMNAAEVGSEVDAGKWGKEGLTHALKKW